MAEQKEQTRDEQLRIQAVGAAISRRDWRAVEQAYNAIRDEFDRRPAAPSPAGGVDAVAVKALEWVEEQRRGTFVKYIARTPFGGYEVNSEFTALTASGPMVCLPDWKGPLDSSGRRAVSVEEAKAAAQADYEARIRSALSPAATSNAVANLLTAAKAAKRYLEPDLVEPGRTVFWDLVSAIKAMESADAK